MGGGEEEEVLITSASWHQTLLRLAWLGTWKKKKKDRRIGWIRTEGGDYRGKICVTLCHDKFEGGRECQERKKSPTWQILILQKINPIFRVLPSGNPRNPPPEPPGAPAASEAANGAREERSVANVAARMTVPFILLLFLILIFWGALCHFLGTITNSQICRSFS